MLLHKYPRHEVYLLLPHSSRAYTKSSIPEVSKEYMDSPNPTDPRVFFFLGKVFPYNHCVNTQGTTEFSKTP
jgi:hypothetical protein